jgi:hypothetical protein
LAKYKEYRQELYDLFVFPIGDEPNNASWTGFQWINPDAMEGYLLIFSKLNNEEKQKEIKLRFQKNQKISLENIITGDQAEYIISSDRLINLNGIENAGFKISH